MRFVIPGDLLDAWESAKTRAEREGIVLRPDVPEPIHNGQILEILIAEYLAGPEYPPQTR